MWSYTSVSSIRFHGVGTDKFLLFYSRYSEVHNQTTRIIVSTQSFIVPLRPLVKLFNSSTVYWLLVTHTFSITPFGKSISYIFTHSFSHSYTP